MFAKPENYPPFSGLLALPLLGESTFELEGDDSRLLYIVKAKTLGGRCVLPVKSYLNFELLDLVR